MNPPSNSEHPRLQDAKRSLVVDMSPAAIDRRLSEYFQLWTFWTKLRRFQKVDPESPPSDATSEPAASANE